MPPLDRSKFVKVLQQTTSKNDNEALAAIRAANKMLSDAGVGWGGLISGSRAPVKTSGTAPPFMRASHNISLVDVFDALVREGLVGPMNIGMDGELTVSYRRWQRDRGSLTRDEKNAVYEAYEKLGEDSKMWEPE